MQHENIKETAGVLENTDVHDYLYFHDLSRPQEMKDIFLITKVNTGIERPYFDVLCFDREIGNTIKYFDELHDGKYYVLRLPDGVRKNINKPPRTPKLG